MFKRLFILVLIIGIYMSVNVFALNGDGTEDNPYIIGSVYDYKEYARLVNSGKGSYSDSYALLVSDVDFSENKYIPIGSFISPYSGDFDGNGYSVMNVKIEEASEVLSSDKCLAAGLFGYTDGADIHDIDCVNVVVNISDSTQSLPVYAGILTGSMGSTNEEKVTSVYGVSVTGSIKVNCPKAKVYAGGIVGYAYTDVENCGFNIENCYSAVDITVSTPRFAIAGGIAGNMEAMQVGVSAQIHKVYSAGKIETEGNSSFAAVGGIVGYMTVEDDWGSFAAELSSQNADIQDSFSCSELVTDSSYSYLGSICGYTMTAVSSNVYCDKDKYFKSSENYSVSGEMTDKSFYSDKDFVTESLLWDTESRWILTDTLPLLNRNERITVTGTVGDGFVVEISGKLPESGFAVIVIYDMDSRVIDTAVYNLALTGNPGKISFEVDKEVKSTALFIFGDMSKLSPYCARTDNN